MNDPEFYKTIAQLAIAEFKDRGAALLLMHILFNQPMNSKIICNN